MTKVLSLHSGPAVLLNRIAQEMTSRIQSISSLAQMGSHSLLSLTWRTERGDVDEYLVYEVKYFYED